MRKKNLLLGVLALLFALPAIAQNDNNLHLLAPLHPKREGRPPFPLHGRIRDNSRSISQTTHKECG